MKRCIFVVLMLMLAGGLLFGLAQAQGPAVAPQQQAYDLSWHVVAGGGDRSQAGVYVLGGTAAEPGAGISPGGSYDLCSGFWCGPTAVGHDVYLPLVLRSRGP